MSKSHFMRRLVCGIGFAFTVFALSTTSIAQDAPAKEKPAAKAAKDDKPKKAKADKGGKKAEKQDRTLKTTTAMVMRKFKNVNLTEEQTVKATAIIKQHAEELGAARAELQKLMTPETKKAMATARKKAKEDGLKGAEAKAAIEKSAGITEENKAAFTAAQEKFKSVTQNIYTAVSELLTEEQKATLGARKAKPKKEKGGVKPKRKKAEKAEKSPVE